MMGKALNSVNSPVAKGTSGILLVPEKLSRRSQEAVCIRCSKCVSVCPMGLEPYLLFKLGKRGFYDRMHNDIVPAGFRTP